jgi:catechol 2,3-dioxygenase-like lactoylglutathione lyase family enzyme
MLVSSCYVDWHDLAINPAATEFSANGLTAWTSGPTNPEAVLNQIVGARMPHVLGIDHVAITVKDLEATCAFYDKLFGARTHLEYAPNGKPLVRQIALGGALLSVHQAGNGLNLVAERPTIGAGDICLLWSGDIESAAALLRKHGIDLISGPDRRRTADGKPSHSVYFRDPDENLLELMAADPGS